MSLLMEALKQAEDAKRDNDEEPPELQNQGPQSEEPLPCVIFDTESEPPPAATELSLSPMDEADEIKANREMEEFAAVLLAVAEEKAPGLDNNAVTEAPAETTVTVIAEPAAPTQEPTPALATPPILEPPPQITVEPVSATPNTNAEAAARMLAASTSRNAAHRRRRILGAIGLGLVLAMAIGGYYYYATLAQTLPYVAMPPPVLPDEAASPDTIENPSTTQTLAADEATLQTPPIDEAIAAPATSDSTAAAPELTATIQPEPAQPASPAEPDQVSSTLQSTYKDYQSWQASLPDLSDEAASTDTNEDAPTTQTSAAAPAPPKAPTVGALPPAWPRPASRPVPGLTSSLQSLAADEATLQMSPIDGDIAVPGPLDITAIQLEPAQPASSAEPKQLTHAENEQLVDSSENGIRITRHMQPDQVGSALQSAYAHYQLGQWSQAEDVYRQVLMHSPANRDARLGLAALAVRAGNRETAQHLYQNLLREDPKNPVARAALAELSDTTSTIDESELKLLLVEHPQSAQLYFTLANVYAAQQRWPYAQQAYFEAHRLSPAHPDYAFNLAVSLEHIGQSRQALDYYRRAIQLAVTHNAQFDPATANQRISDLFARFGR